jgi:PKD repeat protein
MNTRTRVLTPCLAFLLFLSTATTSAQIAGGLPQPAAVPQRPKAVAADMRWYPYALRPPFVGANAVGVDSSDIIYAGEAKFRIGQLPTLPLALTKPLFADQQFVSGYMMVHFKADIRPEDKTYLDELTGVARREDGSQVARWYLPNNALIVWIEDTAQLLALKENDAVDWAGRYEPAYKLDPRIGSMALTSEHRVGRETWQLNVDLMPGHSVANVVWAVEQLGAKVLETVDVRGQRMYDVRYLVVEASADQVVPLAAIEGVRLVQESGDGLRLDDLSGGGKLQNRKLAKDDGSDSPIVTPSSFPLWLDHDLQGQGQLIGIVDTSFYWLNKACKWDAQLYGSYPDGLIDGFGFADPNLSRVLLSSVGAGGGNLKVPRADLLGGATLYGANTSEHGERVAAAALADFYGNNDTKWWEHDVDAWGTWSGNISGLLGPGIAHEAQLYATPVLDSAGDFRWESPGEFETNMGITLSNMSAAGTCTTNHSLGIVEASNTYTQTSVIHDVKAFDHKQMLQCMAAGNDGPGGDTLSSQAVVKNALTVGASDDVLLPEDRADFSSTGPRFDGALKPDLMAPGTDGFPRYLTLAYGLVLPWRSATQGCPFQWSQGTSFSSQIVAGAAALVHQYFEEGRYPGLEPLNDASAALMKAMLINSGHRLTGANLGDGTYPNGYQGWGEPNLSHVLDFGAGARQLIVQDVPEQAGFLSGGDSNRDTVFKVDGSAERLRVTLVWTDEPGSVGSGKKLINDLNLRVTAPNGAVYRGNRINGSSGLSVTGGSADTLNNVENVILANPSGGSWTVTVDPGSGNYAVGQGYALVITGQVSEVTGGGGNQTVPGADFDVSGTSGDAPLTISFANQSTGTITSSAWNFGDGSGSSESDPSHTYTTAGTYGVSLTVSGPLGSDTITKSGLVTVTQGGGTNGPPVAGFTASPTSGPAPLGVGFHDGSTGAITSRLWFFGDGRVGTGPNPTHTFKSAGSYPVTLVISGPFGTDVEMKSGFVTVTTKSVPAPVSGFSGTPTSGFAPLKVSFTDTSSGDVSSHLWLFGDGLSSALANPKHTYGAPGSYTVMHRVSGQGGIDEHTVASFVTVTSAPVPAPLAGFSGTPTSGSIPLDVKFTDTSTGSVSSHSWDFGDGTGSALANPSHVYSLSGSYTVTHQVTGPGGTDQHSVTGYVQASDVDPDPVPTSGRYYLSFTTTTTVPGLGSVRAEDVVVYDLATKTWAMYFDGSDMGVGGSDVNAMHVMSNGDLVVSFDAASQNIPNLYGGPGGSTLVSHTDLVWFQFLNSGADTSGYFVFLFDGSDVGLDTLADDIDGIHEFPGGGLALSFRGTATPNGLASVDDEDVAVFSVLSYGEQTNGSWSSYFDGSSVGLTDQLENVDAVAFDASGNLLFSTEGPWNAGGGQGQDEDVGMFSGAFGTPSTGSVSVLLDLSTLEIAVKKNIDAISFVP